MPPQNGMLGSQFMLTWLEDALRTSRADATELVLNATQQSVTRYAQNEITQNVAAASTRVAVRCVVGQAAARVFINQVDPDAVARAIAEATAIAQRLPQDHGTRPPTHYLAGPMPGAYTSPEAAVAPPFFFAGTAALTPADRAGWIGTITALTRDAGYQAFGTAITAVQELAVVSSLGVRSYAATTEAYLRALLDNGEGTGYADALARDAATIDAEAVAREALTKCRLNVRQIELPPGDYPAVLEPNCVADFVRFPVRWGLGGLSFEQGSSFMAGRIGERVTGTAVSIWDDPLNPNCMPIPIDYEGQPTGRLPLIIDGIGVEVALDAATASRRSSPVATNAHATSPWDTEDPYPEHIVMPGGQGTADDLMHALPRGLRICRLHYTHVPDGKRVVATGTTRDGTFLVENGEIVAAVKNLRFTQPVLEMLAGIEAVGQRKTCRDWWAANGMESTYYYVPALRVAGCHFTGVTTF